MSQDNEIKVHSSMPNRPIPSRRRDIDRYTYEEDLSNLSPRHSPPRSRRQAANIARLTMQTSDSIDTMEDRKLLQYRQDQYSGGRQDRSSYLRHRDSMVKENRRDSNLVKRPPHAKRPSYVPSRDVALAGRTMVHPRNSPSPRQRTNNTKNSGKPHHQLTYVDYTSNRHRPARQSAVLDERVTKHVAQPLYRSISRHGSAQQVRPPPDTRHDVHPDQQQSYAKSTCQRQMSVDPSYRRTHLRRSSLRNGDYSQSSMTSRRGHTTYGPVVGLVEQVLKWLNFAEPAGDARPRYSADYTTESSEEESAMQDPSFWFQRDDIVFKRGRRCVVSSKWVIAVGVYVLAFVFFLWCWHMLPWNNYEPGIF